MIKGKKSQEEMVGFVLIVVLVTVILVIVLGILIRQPAASGKDLGTTQFLKSMMEYTTKCAIGYVPKYDSIGELMGDCYDKRTCVSGDKACNALKSSINEVINASWFVSSEGYYTGYYFNSYINSTNKAENIITVSKGNCSLFKEGDSFLYHQGKIITTTLKICTKV